MAFSLFSNRSSRLKLAIDVGTHSIKAVAFETGNGNSVPRPLKKAVIKLPAHMYVKEVLQSSRSAPPLFRIVSRLRELIFALIKELERMPTRIVIGFGTGFGDNQLVTWNYPTEREKHFFPKDISRILDTVKKKSDDPCCTALISPMKIFANGYPVSPTLLESIPPHLIQELGFQVLLTRFSKEVGSWLYDMQQGLGGLPIEFVPLPVAYQKAMAILPLPPDALLIDIGGETTALSLFKEKELVSFTSFNYGVHHMVRSIAETMNMQLEPVEDMLFQYAKGIMSGAKKSEFQNRLAPSVAEWKNDFLSALDMFYHIGPLPPDIVVVGGGKEIPELQDVIRDPSWIKNYSAADAPSLKTIDATSFFNGENLGGFLTGAEEIGLASLIRYSFNYEPVFAKTS